MLSRLGFAVVCGWICVPSVVFAQSGTRALEGRVIDASGIPLFRAVVAIENTRTLAVRSFIAKRDGTYHFLDLSRDVDYVVWATYESVRSPERRLSQFDNDVRAVINLKIPLRSAAKASADETENCFVSSGIRK